MSPPRASELPAAGRESARRPVAKSNTAIPPLSLVESQNAVAPAAVEKLPTSFGVSPAEIVDLKRLPAVACPCGTARRAFADRQEIPGTIHLTQISQDAVAHYHRHHTEVYVIVACQADAAIELDGRRHLVQPMTSILIPPGVRHRACGEMTVLIFCTPNFDPLDEWFDDPL